MDESIYWHNDDQNKPENKTYDIQEQAKATYKNRSQNMEISWG